MNVLYRRFYFNSDPSKYEHSQVAVRPTRRIQDYEPDFPVEAVVAQERSYLFSCGR